MPQTTTERPGFISASAAKSIALSIGQRVVIIGPDQAGCSKAVGEYAYVVSSGLVLPLGTAAVVVYTGELKGDGRLHRESTLCRSDDYGPEGADWSGHVSF